MTNQLDPPDDVSPEQPHGQGYQHPERVLYHMTPEQGYPTLADAYTYEIFTRQCVLSDLLGNPPELAVTPNDFYLHTGCALIHIGAAFHHWHRSRWRQMMKELARSDAYVANAKLQSRGVLDE